MNIVAQCLGHACVSPPIFHNSKPYLISHNSIPFLSPIPNTLFNRLHGIRIKSRNQRSVGAVYASEPETAFTNFQDRWLLEPVGNGNTKHVGSEVKMPDAFEIVSNEVTIGRLPDKADIVIPVATVSGVHARIKKKEGNLLVTDLDSTNGTFINEKKLRPGVVVSVPPGSYITFGDIHLAKFRVSKLENLEPEDKAETS